MAVKVLVTAQGQHIVSEVKQIENTDSKELVGYWLENPRAAVYGRTEEGQLTVNFGTLCPLSNEQNFSVRADHVVSILEPTEEVVKSYNELVFPPSDEVNEGNTVVTELPEPEEVQVGLTE